jgi:hypothetical protein
MFPRLYICRTIYVPARARQQTDPELPFPASPAPPIAQRHDFCARGSVLPGGMGPD